MSVLRCPRCHQGRLYKSWLEIADNCSECGLYYAAREQGDGPASVSVLFVGALVAITASIVEIKFEPPFWLHAVLWVPLIIIVSLRSLKFVKAALVAMQYQYRKDDFTP